MSRLAIEDFEAAHRSCVEALRSCAGRDWTSRAGSLVWPASLTAAHLTDVLFSYALQAAAHGTLGELPFNELEATPDATPAGLVDGIHAAGVMLASVLRCMPDGATSLWWGRPVGPEEWAAMAGRESLLHTYDIVSGLDGRLDPDASIVAKLLDDGFADPWAQLVRDSGRPFGDGEWATWREAEDERWNRPVPPGSETGLVSDFASGEPASVFGTGWRAITDERMSGTSTADLSILTPGPPVGGGALRVDGVITESEAQLRLVGAAVGLGDSREEAANLSAWQGVRFWARGVERPLGVWSMTAGGLAGRHVVPIGEEWAPHRIPFAWFGSDGSDLTGILFALDTGPGEVWFELGDIRLY